MLVTRKNGTNVQLQRRQAGERRMNFPVAKMVNMEKNLEGGKKKKRKRNRKRRQKQGKEQMNNVRFQTSKNTMNASFQNKSTIGTKTIPRIVTLTNGVVALAAFGIIASSIQIGFQNVVSDPSHVYHVFVYAAKVLTNALKETSPLVQIVPQFLKEIIDILGVKRVPIHSGYAAYSWFADFDPNALLPTIPFGPGSTRSVNMWIPQGTFINGLIPVLMIPNPYTDASGELAWTALMDFMGERVSASHWKLVSSNLANKHEGDASAFSAGIPILGNNNFLSGGYSRLVYSEVPIKTPPWAVFTTSGIAFDGVRNAYEAARSTGDALFLCSQYATDFANRKCATGKNVPKIVNIDFNQWLNVICLWMSLVAQAAVNDPQNIEAAFAVDYFQCKLTFQEFQFLLRNVFMLLFQDTGVMVQSYLMDDGFSSANSFQPFVCGVGTCPTETGGNGFMLPQDFVENMRCSTYTIHNEDGTTFMPVIGVYADDVMEETNYGYFIGEVFYPLFSPAETANKVVRIVKCKNGKEEKIEEFVAETPINITNGQYAGGFVAMNAPSALQVYENIYAAWLVVVKPFVSKLSIVGRDAGITVLKVVSQTDIISYLVEDDKVVLPIMPSRLAKMYALPPTIYSQRVRQALISFEPFLVDPLEKVNDCWVRPQVILVLTNPHASNVTNLQKIQSVLAETNLITYEPGIGQATLQDMAFKYALRNVKARNGDTTVIEDLLLEYEKWGRGGILSALIMAAGGILGSGKSLKKARLS